MDALGMIQHLTLLLWRQNLLAGAKPLKPYLWCKHEKISSMLGAVTLGIERFISEG
jgi:hypothetical protein